MAGMSARLLAEAPGLAAPIGAGLSAARAVNALRGFVVGGGVVAGGQILEQIENPSVAIEESIVETMTAGLLSGAVGGLVGRPAHKTLHESAQNYAETLSDIERAQPLLEPSINGELRAAGAAGTPGRRIPTDEEALNNLELEDLPPGFRWLARVPGSRVKWRYAWSSRLISTKALVKAKSCLPQSKGICGFGKTIWCPLSRSRIIFI
jgi:hypothetical protein